MAPVRFFRPYYTFRPRLNLGFGLSAGFPIAYSSYYGYYDPYYYDPYAYQDPYYGYPYPSTSAPSYPPAYPPSNYPQSAYPSDYPAQSGSVGVQGPNAANTGGVSFEISPGNAEVIVDGQSVGTVDQFTPTSQPLGLPAGRHAIEIRANGYRTVDVDVDIVAGQVIPYQGTLER